jgi:cell division protein FtsZ
VASGEGRARAAAEAAVSSPLLEDINLAGAHGILVNVTAGMDLSIGEFQEVGQIVKQFASEDATVVVGTVIDPELSNQVRVTVVATGLGRPAAAARQPIERAPAREARGPGRDSGVRMVPTAASDFNRYDRPTHQRVKMAVNSDIPPDMSAEELLDIPAFLRRQAD